MRWPDLIESALGSLRQRLLRTFMTVLGVLIGTTSVVVMVSLGVGLTQSLVGDMQNSATATRVTVMPGSASGGGMLGGPASSGSANSRDKIMNAQTVADLGQFEGVKKITPVYSVSANIQFGQHKLEFANVTGMPAKDIADEGLELTAGKLPTAGSGLTFLMGNAVPAWNGLYDDETGQPLEIDWMTQQLFVSFRNENAELSNSGGTSGDTEMTATSAKKFVVPVAGAFGKADDYFNGGTIYADIDQLTAALRQAYPGKALPGQPALPDGSPKGSGFVYSQIYLQAESADRAESLTSELKQAGYNATSNIEVMRLMQRAAILVQAVFGGIGFISLLVAAIGIANTMMMSVYERTKQIGVMKVLGASLGDIRNLFLVESGFIGLIGGTIGLIFSFMMSGLLNLTLGTMAGASMGQSAKISIIPVWLAISSIIFATLIGTVAGWMPANRAMRLSPLAAIRSE